MKLNSIPYNSWKCVKHIESDAINYLSKFGIKVGSLVSVSRRSLLGGMIILKICVPYGVNRLSVRKELAKKILVS